MKIHEFFYLHCINWDRRLSILIFNSNAVTFLCNLISSVSCAQVYGGMRGMKGLVYETSVLDPDEVSTRYSDKRTHEEMSLLRWYLA